MKNKMYRLSHNEIFVESKMCSFFVSLLTLVNKKNVLKPDGSHSFLLERLMFEITVVSHQFFPSNIHRLKITPLT